MAWWRQKNAPATASKKSVTTGVFTKCERCSEILPEADVRENLNVCPRCAYHHGLTAWQRLEMLVDAGTFVELAAGLEPVDPLNFKDSKPYKERIKTSRKQSGFSEAALVGTADVLGLPVAIGALVFDYMGGSMGSVVGERLARLAECGVAQRRPVVICSASGGARMQEGILSLMQMAKTTAALRRLKDAGLPYISLLHHPTTGGVAASFAMLGDVIIAEPGALVGFAGPRVIEQTIRQKLPDGFQRSEFLLQHGMLDAVVHRRDLKDYVARAFAFMAPV